MLSQLILVVEPSVIFVEMNCLGAIQWPCPKPRSTHRSGVLCAESQRHRELESKRNEAFRRVHGFLEQLGTSIFRSHTTDTGCHITFCLQLGCYASRSGKVYVKATDHDRSMHENELPMIPLMRPLSLVPVDTRLLGKMF